MMTDRPELFDGMRLVPCAVMTDNDNPQAGWLFIPHADGKWVSAAKLQPFSQQIINYWWNRPSSAEVRAEEQEPVYAYRRKGLEYFCTCDEARYNELAQKPNLFEVTTFYTAPQPPAPCQKCAESEKTLQAIAEHVDWAFIGDLDDVVASRINERNAAIAHFAAERNALQSKVAEQACDKGLMRIKVAEQAALIEKCEKAMRSNNYDRMSETLADIAERKKV